MRHRGALAASIAIALAASGFAASGSTAGSVPNLSWTSLLPPLSSPVAPQPYPVPNCRKPTVRCIDVEIRRLRRLQARLGCDHRAVFATTYLAVTRTLREMLRHEPSFFRYPGYLFTEDALFANVYFDALRAWQRGEDVPAAWRIAFEVAASDSRSAGQDLLLGINAHVQNDMPFVLAALGLRAPSGASRKVDHDRFNEVLNRAYERAVRAAERRYDPSVGLSNSPLTPLDDIGGLELVRGWRELVWRNAERLLNAETEAARRQVAEQIEAHAAAWASLIAAPSAEGYGAVRDAYCRERLGN